MNDNATRGEHRQRSDDLPPEPRRRSDVMAVSSMFWMAVGWAVLIYLAVFFPFPLWW
jgi:hypothetical protein